jgi:recombination protein RecA
MDPKLEAIVKKARKKYGEDAIVKGGDLHDAVIPRTTTGSLAYDVALGGGWAANQWTEIVGDESHGKSALALRTIAANQKADPKHTTVLFAAEEFVPTYALMQGCDLDRILVVNDNILEHVFQMAIDVLNERAADLVLIDSLPALMPLREFDGTMEDLQPGTAAILNNKFFRMSGAAIKRSLTDPADRACTGLIINQWREKIGGYGDPRTTPGGRGKNFACFIRAEVRRDEWITNTKEQKIGQTIKLRNIKNKTAPPGVTGLADFYFADGNGMTAGQWDTLKEIVNVGILYEAITRAGAYYRFDYNGDQLQWQGREALVDALRDDEAVARAIEQAVMAKVNPGLKPTKKVTKRKASV